MASAMIEDERAALRASQSPIGGKHGRKHKHHKKYQQQQQQSMSSSSVITITGERERPRGYLVDRNQSACRNYFGQIEGSMRKFAACPDTAKTTITNNWSVQYRQHGSEPGSKRCGDPTRAYVLAAKLAWVQNTFPVPVFLSSDSFRGNCYGEGQQRGFFVAPPAHTISFDTPKPILLASRQLFSKIVTIYGHCDSKSSDTGVSKMDDGGYLIRPGTPLCKVLEDGQTNDSEPYDLQEMRVSFGAGDFRYHVSKRLYESAQYHFRQKILPRLPHIDATAICVRASRANADWDAPLGMFSGEAGESCDAEIFNIQGSVSFLLEMEYRLIA